MKTLIVLLGLFVVPTGYEIKPTKPDCGGSHCQLTLEDAKAIADFQDGSLDAIRTLKAENDKLKRTCARGNDA